MEKIEPVSHDEPCPLNKGNMARYWVTRTLDELMDGPGDEPDCTCDEKDDWDNPPGYSAAIQELGYEGDG